MRKALIAVAVATALFAVGAFAASFAVQSEDIASGADPVDKCATNVVVDFGAPALTGSPATWTVSGATVRFQDAAGASEDGCDRHDARLALSVGTVPNGPGTYQQVGGLSPVDSGQALFTFDPISVELVVGASVVVDGATLTADLP